MCGHKTMTKRYLSENKELMKEWDFEANEDLDPNLLTVGSNKKVSWVCSKCGHKWKTSIYHRAINGRNCPNCHHGNWGKDKKSLAETNPEIAIDWHPTKNKSLTPGMFTRGSRFKVWWKCHKCGCEWEQGIQHYRGCAQCKKSDKLQERSLALTYPELIKEWHPTKNGKLTPYDVTYANNKMAWWKCAKCGYEWQAIISNRSTLNRGCPCCAGRAVVKGVNDLATTHPEIAKEWHPTKNGELKPNCVTKGSRHKVWWICPQGHEYQATVNHRTSKDATQCPTCYSGRQTSFAEQSFYYYLKLLYPDAINRYTADFLGKMELDIYIPALSVAIEYDGEAWHKTEKEEREERKYRICKEHNIHLIRLKEKIYSDVKNADECYIFPDLYRAKNLNRVIPNILHMLDNSIHSFSKSVNDSPMIKDYDVDVERDRIKILSNYATRYKEDSLADLYPEIAKEWHPTKNGNLQPNMFKAQSGHKVWWICPDCGYEYETTINHRKNGTSCPKCGIKRSAEKRSKSVCMIDPVTYQVIRKFKSITDIKTELGINISNISTVCNGKRPKAGGYIWRYEDDLYNEDTHSTVEM